MRKHASSWGKVLPSKETCFLLRNVHPCEEASFLVRKHVLIRKHNSAWGSILSHEELHWLMRKHISSWGRMFPPEEACFLLRKCASSWWSLLLHEETLFLTRNQVKAPQKNFWRFAQNFFLTLSPFHRVFLDSNCFLTCLMIPQSFSVLSWRIYTPAIQIYWINIQIYQVFLWIL